MKALKNISKIGALVSAIALVLYQNASNGFMRLTTIEWIIIWSVAVNLLSICFVLYILSNKGEKFWGVVFIPYLIAKIIYDISAYGQIRTLNPDYWPLVNDIMVLWLAAGMFFCLIESKIYKWLQRLKAYCLRLRELL